MQNSFIAYINDNYVTHNQAKISVLDLGLTRGYGVFDFFRTYNGNPFHFIDHYERLKNSAKMLYLNLPISPEKLLDIIKILMKKNKQKDAAVKIILTGGEALHSLDLNTNPTLIVLTFPLQLYLPKYYTEGVKLVTKKHIPYLSECKTLNYIPALVSMHQAKKLNAFEVLYTDENQNILEGATSNFFAFKNNKLITPSKNIMKGITRKVILKLAKDIFDIEERVVHKSELNTFDEVFISASNKEIMPVKQINEIIFSVGKNTQQIMHLFREYTNHYSNIKNCTL